MNDSMNFDDYISEYSKRFCAAFNEIKNAPVEGDVELF